MRYHLWQSCPTLSCIVSVLQVKDHHHLHPLTFKFYLCVRENQLKCQHSKKKHRNRFVRTNFYHFIFLSCFQLAEYWGNSCSFILTAFKVEYKWASGLDNFILIRLLLFSSVCYLLRFEDIRADTAAGKYGVQF